MKVSLEVAGEGSVDVLLASLQVVVAPTVQAWK